MGRLRSGHHRVIASLFLLVMVHQVKAQRPVDIESYQAVETRIKTILSRQPSSSSPFLSWCTKNRFVAENTSDPGRRLPSQSGASLDIRLRCARAHIEATDVTLKRGIEAFDATDYPTALDLLTPIERQNGQWGANGTPSRNELPVEPSSAKVTSELGRAASRHQVDAGVSVVRVTGLRVIPWKSYRAMRAAIAAYEKYKYLAPEAVFSFAVLPSPGTTLPPNFELRVRTNDGTEFPITLEHGMLFQLPALPDPDADASLVSNVRDGQLRIGLLLHSQNVPPDQERLGDVRLRNEISQAIADVEHPNYDPMCWRRRGASRCRPRHVTVWYKPRAPASGAWLVEGNRKEALENNGDLDYPSYKIPVNAGHLGNDAVIEFTYKKPLGSVRQTVVMIYDESNR